MITLTVDDVLEDVDIEVEETANDVEIEIDSIVNAGSNGSAVFIEA